MSYTRQNFTDGKVLTAAQLNNIELGIVKVEEDLNTTLTDELGTIETRLEDIEDSIPLTDTELSSTSTNPVQNKVINTKFDEVIASIPPSISVDNTLSNSSSHPVENQVITNALDNKQNKLPVNTGGSSNRVWVTTCNKLKDADGNKRPAIIIGTVIISRTTEGEDFFASLIDTTSADILGNVFSGWPILAKVTELLIMTDENNTVGAYSDYIEVVSKNSTLKVDGVTTNTTTLTYYWTYPYYFKRVIAGSSGEDQYTAHSSGPYVGRVTTANFFNKWEAWEINYNLPADDPCNIDVAYDDLTNAEAYKVLIMRKFQKARFNASELDSEITLLSDYFTTENGFYFDIGGAFDNEEPYQECILSTDPLGRITIESSALDYHAVNNKRLNEQIDVKLNEFYNNKILKLNNINPFVSYKIYRNELGITDVTGRDQSVEKDMTGWYRIAVGLGNMLCSNMFHVNVYVNRPGYMGGVYFIVDQMNYDTTPTIKLIDYSTRKNATDVIDKIRVVYNPSQAFLSYVEIHINKNSSSTCDGWGGGSGSKVMYEISVETLFNQIGTNFNLIDPPEIPEGGVESTLVTDELSSGYSQVVINTTVG